MRFLALCLAVPMSAFDINTFSKACRIFPPFSKECCDGIEAASSNPAFGQANEELEGASGEAEAGAFQRCAASSAPCSVTLPNSTLVSAMCCADDAMDGWSQPGPTKAVDAVEAAGQMISGGGRVWWVKVNQTFFNNGQVYRKIITHQYPTWFPAACSDANDTKAMGYFESMMCASAPQMLECTSTVSDI